MRELYAYVWRSSASQQIVLIILAIIAAVLATAPLELQRHIINTLAGHEKVENLALLCSGYLIAVLSIGGLKYIVNIRSAGLGEFMIRSLREAVLRSASPSINPDATPDESRKDKSGALVTTISNQAEAVGKFVGDCISTPIVVKAILAEMPGTYGMIASAAPPSETHAPPKIPRATLLDTPRASRRCEHQPAAITRITLAPAGSAPNRPIEPCVKDPDARACAHAREASKNPFNLNLLRGGDQRWQAHLAERNSDFWSFLRGSLG